MNINGVQNKIKPVKKIIIGLLSIGLLSGCVQEQDQTPLYPVSNATPPPIVSEESVTYKGELFFYTDAFTLLPEAVELNVEEGTSLAYTAVNALIEGPKTTALKPIFTSWLPLSVERVLISGDVCLVFLAGEPKEAKEQDILLVRAAVASTMKGVEGSLYTDVYINNEQPVYRGRPIGALRPVVAGINVLNYQYPPSAEDSGTSDRITEEHDVIYYVADLAGKLICCDVRTLQYDINSSISDILALVISGLGETPTRHDIMKPALPPGIKYESSTFLRETRRRQLEESESLAVGSRNTYEEITTFSAIPAEPGWLSIYLRGNEPVFNDQLAYAALVNTITGFMPYIMGLRVFYNGSLVKPDDVLERVSLIPGDYMLRKDFLNSIGDTITLYYPDKNGLGLIPATFLAEQSANTNAEFMLRTLLENDLPAGLPLYPLSPSDIISVTIYKDTAVVNCNESFFENLNELTALMPFDMATSIRLGVFSIVNTLCGIRGVDRVQFLQDGKRIEKSLGKEDYVDKIFLGNPLFYNPGLNLSQ